MTHTDLITALQQATEPSRELEAREARMLEWKSDSDDGCYAYSGNAYIGCVIQTIDGYRWEILRLVGTGLATSMSEAKAAAAPKVEERP